ncbi:Hypothetical predicted protein [Paramuricea clavata]|uniref:Uncharacterized protein n=1 Tax=Paramuricea clavata TaxID=317549 RepID=A0A6S7IWB4_PARCT|nr:Hypothetical predicted protein [Paramuricea clavata]
MPVTRQTTYQPDEFRADMKEAIQSELHQFFKSSYFKTILSEAVNTLIEQSVQQATFPLIKRIEALEAELTKVTIKANENEQYSRKYNLRIIGLVETDGEDCVQKVVQFVDEKLHLNILKEEIDRAHRLGPKISTQSRPLIVKFKSYGTKAAICKRRKDLKGTQFYINEDLTKYNVNLFKYAREHNTHIKSVWTTDGKY